MDTNEQTQEAATEVVTSGKRGRKPASTEISDVIAVTTGTVLVTVVGNSPIILNRMSEKAKHELLYPAGRKTAVARATSLKHDPVSEYQASPYILRDETAPTYLAVLSTAFKGALRNAALDMPGTKKAQVGRLTYIPGEYVGIYGVPKLHMSVVRSADMNKTPDIRTRAIIPAWAAQVRITYVEPLIRAQAVVNLLAAAGLTIGIGDWRPEKGSGSYGQFRIVGQNDPEYLRIVAEGGRTVQKDGIDNPLPYDDETAELLSWFQQEREIRRAKGVAAA